MNDEELKDLFSAFNDVSASDSLKAATLDGILAASAADESAPVAEDEQAASVSSTAHETPAAKAADKPVVRAVRGGRKGMRAKWRTIRVAAVAACLTLALSGGVAYATPTSRITVSQGGTTIELGVNCFGIAVSASASDDAGQKIIDEMNGLLHVPYQDSVSRVSDSLKQANPESPVEVQAQGEDDMQDQQPETSGSSLVQQASPTNQTAVSTENQPVVQSEYAEGGAGQQSGKADTGSAGSSSKPAASAPSGIVGDNKASKADSGGQVVSGTAEVPSQPIGSVNAGAGEATAATPATTVEEPAPAQSADPVSEPASEPDSKPEAYTTGDDPSTPPADDTASESDEDEAPQRY